MKRFVFYHLNKCAGTTLLYALQDRFNYADCVFMERFDAQSADESGDFPDYEELSRARFIHEPGGMRNWKSMLPNVSTFSMFRDPIDRLYSQWMMICNWSDEAVRSRSGHEAMLATARAGFDQFLVSCDPLNQLHRWNGMTHHLLMGERSMLDRWRALEGLHDPIFAQQALDLALANLQTLDLVGIVEAFEESYDSLNVAFPFAPSGPPQAHNVRGERRYRSLLDRETLGHANAATSLDEVLYAEACDLFRKQTLRLKAEFGDDLKAAAAKRYAASFDEAPEWALVSMGDPLLGSGWHAREVNGAKLSRWMGPKPVSRLDVRIQKKGRLFIRARCTGFMVPGQIDSFHMSADGVALELSSWVHLGRFRYFEAAISADRLDAGSVLRLELDCGVVHAPGNPNDPRLLGLEFSEIEVGPASGFRPGAPGTPLSAMA